MHVTNEGARVKKSHETSSTCGDAPCSVSRLRAESQHAHQRALLLQGAELYMERREHALIKEKLLFLSVFFFNVAASRCLAKRVGERICVVRGSDTVAADPLSLHHTRTRTHTAAAAAEAGLHRSPHRCRCRVAPIATQWSSGVQTGRNSRTHTHTRTQFIPCVIPPRALNPFLHICPRRALWPSIPAQRSAAQTPGWLRVTL